MKAPLHTFTYTGRRHVNFKLFWKWADTVYCFRSYAAALAVLFEKKRGYRRRYARWWGIKRKRVRNGKLIALGRIFSNLHRSSCKRDGVRIHKVRSLWLKNLSLRLDSDRPLEALLQNLETKRKSPHLLELFNADVSYFLVDTSDVTA